MSSNDTASEHVPDRSGNNHKRAACIRIRNERGTIDNQVPPRFATILKANRAQLVVLLVFLQLIRTESKDKMRLVLIRLTVIISIVALTCSFYLDGSTNSYSQFRKWGGGTNGSLEFEFKTDQPNGLLLYTDDGGTYDFFEIKLVEGALRLRYNLGGGAQIIIVGRELNDGHWHKVHVQRHEDRTILSVDGVSQMRTSRGKEFNFGRFATNSHVFIGGMPTWYNTKLTLLALPSVIFEPRFVGSVRNLVYPDIEGGPPRRQETRPKDHRVSYLQRF